MELDDIKVIAIVGAGTMGLGIAQAAAMAGLEVLLYDVDTAIAEKAIIQIEKNLLKGIDKSKVTQQQKENTLSNIRVISQLKEVKADVIIEAIVERLAIKQKLFTELEKQNGESTILASNTSSIPITQIAKGLKVPERVIGMHFFNPAHIMKLVEVISGVETAERTAELIKALAIKLGKVPVMAKDSPGFIVNRVARHFYVESLLVLEEGVADVTTVDRLMEASGFKMGPFRLMDLIGIDTNFAVTTSMYNAFYQDGKFRPSRIQQQKVDAGHYGKKTGEGFYKY